MGLIEDYLKDAEKKDKPPREKNNLIKIINIIFLLLSMILSFIVFLTWINLDNCNLLNTLLYFFSSCAQTMGALVAIVMTAIYALVQTIKPNNNPACEPVNRLLFKDNSLLLAIYLSLAMILLSLFSILIARVVDLDKFKIYIFICAIVTLALGLSGIYYLLIFLFRRGPLYINPSMLIKEDIYDRISKQKISNKILNDFNILRDYYEICILMNTFSKGTYYTNQPFIFENSQKIYFSDYVTQKIDLNKLPKSYFGNLYKSLSEKLIQDSNNILPQKEEEKKNIYFALMISLYLSINWKITLPSNKYFEYYRNTLSTVIFFLYLSRREYYKYALTGLMTNTFNLAHEDILPFTHIKKYADIDIPHKKYFIGWLFTFDTFIKENIYFFNIWENKIIEQLIMIDYNSITIDDEIPYLLTKICYCCIIRQYTYFIHSGEINQKDVKDIITATKYLQLIRNKIGELLFIIINSQEQFIVDNDLISEDLVLRFLIALPINEKLLLSQKNKIETQYNYNKELFNNQDQRSVEEALLSEDQRIISFIYGYCFLDHQLTSKIFEALGSLIKVDKSKYLELINIDKRLSELGERLRESCSKTDN